MEFNMLLAVCFRSVLFVLRAGKRRGNIDLTRDEAVRLELQW
jgi:hypothetical protein